MSSIVYAIVFSGQLVEGFQPISVKAHMAKMLKADGDKMAALFSGKPVVLKRTPDKQMAIKYGQALKKIGADVKIKAIKGANQPAAAPAPASAATDTAAPAAAPAASALSLAPNEGNIVEPKPDAPPPDIDLSGIELAADDGSLLVEPKPEEHVEIDLSEYSVSENDGTPLVEPSGEEVPRVEAPDFGLDEPGAVLETLKEEVEELHPDTSGMTLALTGSDLLEPEERDQGAPPEAPDTSKIHLVPNFDV